MNDVKSLTNSLLSLFHSLTRIPFLLMPFPQTSSSCKSCKKKKQKQKKHWTLIISAPHLQSAKKALISYESLWAFSLPLDINNKKEIYSVSNKYWAVLIAVFISSSTMVVRWAGNVLALTDFCLSSFRDQWINNYKLHIEASIIDFSPLIVP